MVGPQALWLACRVPHLYSSRAESSAVRRQAKSYFSSGTNWRGHQESPKRRQSVAQEPTVYREEQTERSVYEKPLLRVSFYLSKSVSRKHPTPDCNQGVLPRMQCVGSPGCSVWNPQNAAVCAPHARMQCVGSPVSSLLFY